MFENLKIPTPCHIFDMDQLKTNLSILKLLGEKTHSKVLYAIKGCSQQEILPYISEILDGACTSGYNEILLANKFKFREIHTFSTAYNENEISMIAQKVML